MNRRGARKQHSDHASGTNTGTRSRLRLAVRVEAERSCQRSCLLGNHRSCSYTVWARRIRHSAIRKPNAGTHSTSSTWFETSAAPRAQLLLLGENGIIDARRLALASLDEVFEIDPDILHQRFVSHVTRLATEAAEKALAAAGLDARPSRRARSREHVHGVFMPWAERSRRRASGPAPRLARVRSRPRLRRCAAELAARRRAARVGPVRAGGLGLRRAQQRRDVSRRRPGRADQRVPVRRRRRRGGLAAPSHRAGTRRIEWKAIGSPCNPTSATRCASSSAAACCATC